MRRWAYVTGRWVRATLLAVLLAVSAGALPGRAQDSTSVSEVAQAENAQAEAVRYDTGAVAVRLPQPATLDRFRADPDFVYEEAPDERAPWYTVLWRWIVEAILEPIFGSVPADVYRWMLYAVVAVVLFWTVTRLLRLHPGSLFRPRRQPRGLRFDEVEGDIRAVDFGARIAAAEAAGAYRRAVRLRYLQMLQALTEHGHIDWQRDKTNHEYLRELPANLRPAFARLTYLFEHVWYGDQPVDADRYARARNTFDAFAEQLATRTDGPLPAVA